MSDALYGPAGFYRDAGAPGHHFRTAAHTGSEWAAAIAALADRVDEALARPADFWVVDVGAGGGELLRELARLAPSRWRLIGVDLAPRSPGLPQRVQWQSQPPAAVTGLLLAVELLDVVPVEVVELTAQGVRRVEVDGDGNERLGGLPDRVDLEWLAQWWDGAVVGDRTESGYSRDELWARLRGAVTRGLAVAIDYRRCNPPRPDGTLTGFRDGRQVAPVPDGTCDLTAHVFFESMQRVGDIVVSQRDALHQLGLTVRQRPRYDGDSEAYLNALSSMGHVAELTDPLGLGGFTWLVHPVAVENPLADPAQVLPRNTPARRTSVRTSSTPR